MGLLTIPTVILLFILTIAVFAIVCLLIFIGIINIGHKQKANHDDTEEKPIGEQVKERQEEVKKAHDEVEK